MRQTVIYKVITYTCRACGAPVAKHRDDLLYVDSPFQPCPRCKAENVIPTNQEFETLSPEDRSSFFWGYLVGGMARASAY